MSERIFGRKVFIDKKGYCRISFGGKSLCVHRMVWEIYNGPIPKGMVCHHRNFCKTDNRIENLQLMTKKEHDSLHCKIRMTPEVRKKISESKMGEKNPRYGKEPWNKGIKMTAEQKAKMNNGLLGKTGNRCKNTKFFYTIIDLNTGEIIGEREPIIFYKNFLSKPRAIQHLKVGKYTKFRKNSPLTGLCVIKTIK